MSFFEEFDDVDLNTDENDFFVMKINIWLINLIH